MKNFLNWLGSQDRSVPEMVLITFTLLLLVLLSIGVLGYAVSREPYLVFGLVLSGLAAFWVQLYMKFLLNRSRVFWFKSFDSLYWPSDKWDVLYSPGDSEHIQLRYRLRADREKSFIVGLNEAGEYHVTDYHRSSYNLSSAEAGKVVRSVQEKYQDRSTTTQERTEQ